MKKIIKNKLYDTETAKLIRTGCSRYDCGNFSYFEENHYRRRMGNTFFMEKVAL